MGFISKWFDSLHNKSDKADLDSSVEITLPTDGRTSESLNDIPSQETDLSLIAVISAAVAMMMSNESGAAAPYPGFRVTRIRRLM